MNTRFLLILLSFSMSGCSLIYSYKDNLPQQIDKWAAEKKYNTALDTISHIKPDHKDYRIIQKKKKSIQRRMYAYEKAAIEKSTLLTSQGDWIKAFKLLDEVSNNIIDKTKIEKHHAKLLKKRNIVISIYEKDILYNQAEDLANKMELYNKIKRTVSLNERNQLNVSEFDESRNQTSLMLAALSEQQYKKSEYNNAFDSINLALKLKPAPDIVDRLKTTKKQINKATRQQKSTHIKKAKNLLSKLSQGYSHAILSKTKKTIVWLSRNKEDRKTYSKLIKQLASHLRKGVRQRFEAARSLYSKGKTQEALSIWLELKELEPDNTKLQSHIERAEKILIKLEELSNKPKK